MNVLSTMDSVVHFRLPSRKYVLGLAPCWTNSSAMFKSRMMVVSSFIVSINTVSEPPIVGFLCKDNFTFHVRSNVFSQGDIPPSTTVLLFGFAPLWRSVDISCGLIKSFPSRDAWHNQAVVQLACFSLQGRLLVAFAERTNQGRTGQLETRNCP